MVDTALVCLACGWAAKTAIEFFLHEHTHRERAPNEPTVVNINQTTEIDNSTVVNLTFNLIGPSGAIHLQGARQVELRFSKHSSDPPDLFGSPYSPVESTYVMPSGVAQGLDSNRPAWVGVNIPPSGVTATLNPVDAWRLSD